LALTLRDLEVEQLAVVEVVQTFDYRREVAVVIRSILRA